MNSNEHCLEFRNIKVSLLELRVWLDGKEIHFTKTELRLLLVFLVEPYRTFTREELVRRVDVTSLGALHMLITRLRLLLDQQYVFTVRTVGYSFARLERLRSIPIPEEKESLSGWEVHMDRSPLK